MLATFATVAALPVPAVLRARYAAVLLPLTLILSAASCLRAMRTTRAQNRRLWAIVFSVVVMLAVGNVYRAGHIAVAGHLKNASQIDDVALLVSVFGMVPLALLLSERRRLGILSRVRRFVDFSAILVISLTVLTIGLIRPLRLLSSGREAAELALGLAFPVLILALVAYLLAFKRGHWFADEVLLFCAMAFGAVAAFLAVIASAGGLAEPGRLMFFVLTAFQLLSALSWGMAGAYRAGRHNVGSRHPVPQVEQPVNLGLGVQVIALLMVPAMIAYGSVLGAGLDRTTIVVLAVLLTALVIAKNVLGGLENRQLAITAFTDPLTGLFSNRYFHDRLVMEVEEARREGARLALAIIDIDGFEDLTRTFGHAAGDRRLRWFAGSLLETAEDADLLFRLGADEFAWIMPGVDSQTALERTGRLKDDAVNAADGVDQPLTFTAGIAGLPEHSADPGELLRFAQGAGYWAVNRGPGSRVVYDPNEVQALDSREHVRRVQEQSHRGLVESLAQAVDARDPYTRFHSSNVARLAEPLAVAVGFDPDQVALMVAAALLHDVGKIGVADAILSKPARLSESETEIIREHPALGARILSASAHPDVTRWVYEHHEHWDGTGYPEGLSGEEISMGGRILAVCDAYDAITTERPYRRAASRDAAIAELTRCAGTQFDPRLVDLLVAHVAEVGER